MFTEVPKEKVSPEEDLIDDYLIASINRRTLSHRNRTRTLLNTEQAVEALSPRHVRYQSYFIESIAMDLFLSLGKPAIR